MSENESHMRIALETAKTSEWPFAAAVFRDGELIAVSGTGGDDNPLGHAEIEVIRKVCASHGANTLRGTEVVLVATCEPCAMCMGAIWYAGIRKVVYGSSINEMHDIFPYDDWVLTKEMLDELSHGALEVLGGILSPEVCEVYRNHPKSSGKV